MKPTASVSSGFVVLMQPARQIRAKGHRDCKLHELRAILNYLEYFVVVLLLTDILIRKIMSDAKPLDRKLHLLSSCAQGSRRCIIPTFFPLRTPRSSQVFLSVLKILGRSPISLTSKNTPVASLLITRDTRRSDGQESR
jgi:hypothetical protein